MRKAIVLAVLTVALMVAPVAADHNADIQPSDPEDLTLDSNNGYSVDKQFDGSDSSPESSILSYTWSIKETAQSDSGVINNFTFDRSNPGSNTVQLTVSNSTHNNTAEVTQTLHDVPNITISANRTIDPLNPNETVKFTSEVTNAFDGSVSFDWKVDGTSKGSGENFSRAFGSTGDFTVNLTVTDNVDNSGSAWKTVNVESSSGSNDSSSSSGGGGGGGTSVSTSSSSQSINFFPNIDSGETKDVNIDNPGRFGVSKISITTSQGAKDVSVTVNKQDGAPSDVSVEVSGEVYRYLNIETDNINDSATEEVEIEFPVNKSWIDENNIKEETIHLKRYNNGNWDSLNTTEESESDDEISYKATSPGLSYFSVSGDSETTEEQEETEEDGNATEGPVCGDGTCAGAESWVSCSEDCEKPDRVKELENTIGDLKEQYGEESRRFQLLENATDELAAGNYNAAEKLVDEAKQSGGGIWSTVLIILVILLVLIIGGVAYWWFSEGSSEAYDEREPVAF